MINENTEKSIKEFIEIIFDLYKEEKLDKTFAVNRIIDLIKEMNIVYHETCNEIDILFEKNDWTT